MGTIDILSGLPRLTKRGFPSCGLSAEDRSFPPALESWTSFDLRSTAVNGYFPALVAEGAESAADDLIHGLGDGELTGTDGDGCVELWPPAVIVRKHHAGAFFEGEEY